jgi:murein DD-endopeptidase MepM/ murein hydrolase activator NlpD
MALRFDTFIPPLGSTGNVYQPYGNPLSAFQTFIPPLYAQGWSNPLFNAAQSYQYSFARDMANLQQQAETNRGFGLNDIWDKMGDWLWNRNDNDKVSGALQDAQSIPNAKIDLTPFNRQSAPSPANVSSGMPRTDPYLRYGITQTYHNPSSWYPSGLHPGVDYGMGVGTMVGSPVAGTVIQVGPYGDYGNLVIVRDAQGYQHYLSHLSQFNVHPNDAVTLGQILGLSGGVKGAPGSGLSSGPHLHWEVRDSSGNTVDPNTWLSYGI